MRMGLGIYLGMAHAPTAAEVTAPTLASALVNAAGTTLTLTYNETLDARSVPATGAFSLSGTASTVSGVNVTGSTVALTLSPAVGGGVAVTLSYRPGGSPIQDTAGNDAASLSGQAVTNNSLANRVTSGLILELDTADAYLAFDGSNRISAWNDKSGAGNHGSSAAGLPLRVPNVLDGKNAVRFDAASVRIGRTALVGGARGAV